MRKKLSKLNLKIVESFKIFGPIALAVIIAGFVVMAIMGMNLGLDFTGGAEIQVNLGVNSTNEVQTVKEYIEKDIIEANDLVLGAASRTAKEDDGTYSLTFRLAYHMKGKKNVNQEEYLDFVRNDIKDKITKYIEDNYDSEFTSEDVLVYDVGASTASRQLKNAIFATAIAIVAMLIYIIIRFQLASGIAAVIALLHDVLVMTALTTIFRIEVNSTFIAAIITIIGYSINATIVLFDRIREYTKSESNASLTDTQIVNKSIADTLSRTIYTTVTTLVMILLLAILGVSSIREFALPIIFGLVAGTYSSVLLSGSFWVMLRKVIKPKKNKKSGYAAIAKSKAE